MAFKTSVNIKFDIGNREFLKRYIPTPSHTEVLKGVLEGFNTKMNNAHIVIGPYGTGKSLVATILNNIVTKASPEKDINILINKFKYFDDNIATKIREVSQLEKKYIPVMLTGNEGRFRKVLLGSIVKALKNEKIKFVIPGVSRKIVDTIDIWKNDFPQTYTSFEELLNQSDKEIEVFLEQINKQDEVAVKYFEEIYPQLTSGASFETNYDENFSLQMEYIAELVNRYNLGLFIIHDEFGRFLQGLDGKRLNEAMQDIQDLAEISNRNKSLQLMFITHKSLRMYFKGMDKEVAKEFQRIEKRFRQYHISNDQKTFLKISEVILTENIKDKPHINEKKYLRTLSNLKKYPLFPSLNPKERQKVIVESMYPLHPITLYMLPELSKVFGQNERTLFTFLESDERGGLSYQIKQSNDYYLPHQLFDYFFPNVNENELDDDISQHLLLYKKAIVRIPDKTLEKELVTRIVKFISLWNLCGLQKEQKISTEFLSFAIEIEIEKLKEILKVLQKSKVLRFNLLNEHWEIHSGSSVDISGKIKKIAENFILDKDKALKILNTHLNQKYYFPERYNDEKDMTRFAKVEVILEEDLVNISKKASRDNRHADIMIYYVLPENKNSIGTIKKKISELSLEEDILFVVHYNPLVKVKKTIIESFVIDELLQDRALLAEDKGIKEELKILYNEGVYRINRYLGALARFDEGLKWILSNKMVEIKDEIRMSDLLSEICDTLYNQTPRVVSDSFNRMNISSQQKKGAIAVVNGIITSYKDKQFGIVGNGPEYAIYAALFKNNKCFYNNINELEYSSIDYKPYEILRKKLIQLLNEKPKGNFNELIKIFTSPPFGIRKPLIPILLVALLRDRWNEFMLYRHEMFVPGLNGEKLYEILNEEGPENYQYVYEQVSEKDIEFFNCTEKYFSEYVESRLEGRARILITSATLINWLRSLPRITQISNQVQDEFKWFRDIIKRTEVSPQESISILSKHFTSENVEELLSLKVYGENYLEKIKESLINEILEITHLKSFEELQDFSLNVHEYVKKNNKFVYVINEIDKDNWVSKLIERYFGVPIENWSDATYDAFLKQLRLDYHEAINFYEVSQDTPLGDKEVSGGYNFIEINIGEKKRVISEVDFSLKTRTIHSNIERIINQAGRNISQKELEYMVYLLLDKYVE
ncbi:hypothetical protein [Bacillus cereus]|uniref:hypothetical protein n=1 Tax=Bacillus cereus TaxID=1396 RepID=UPI000C28D826|nr:hypothetical protein [Bacillus cereus]MDZ4554950.1 hypothetical protein [Bacillus cereus]